MKYVLLFLAIFSTSAFAVFDDNSTNQTQLQGQAQGQLQGQGQAQFTNVDVSNRISNYVRQNAAAFAAGGSARSNSDSFSKSSSNSGGNSQSTVITDTGKLDYSGKYEVKNVPNVFSGNVYPTAPCMGSSTIGGAGVGFGLSVGTSWTDDECGIRETSRSFSGLGKADDALKVLCTSKYAAAAPSCASAQPRE